VSRDEGWSLLVAGATVCLIFVVPALLAGAPIMLPIAFIAVGCVVALPVILIGRLFPGNRKRLEEAKAKAATQADRLAEYQRAGLKSDRSFLTGKVVVSGQHGAVAFKQYNVPADKNSPGRMIVGIETSAPGEFVVELETAATKLAKGIGMVEEFQTGDAELDEKYYFAGLTDEYVRDVFSNRQNLDATRRILTGRCTRLEKTEDELNASAQGQELFSVAEIKQLVEQLASFRLPSEVGGEEQETMSGRHAAWTVMAAGVLVAAAGFWGLISTNPLLDGGWTFATHEAALLGVLTAGFFMGVYFLFKGHSMQAKLFLTLLIASPLIVCAFAGVLMIANEKLDRSEAISHQAHLVSRYTTRGKRSTYYHLTFRSWRGLDSEHVEVEHGTYLMAAQRPGVWELRTHEGWLGQPWIESINMPTPAQDVRSPK